METSGTVAGDITTPPLELDASKASFEESTNRPPPGVDPDARSKSGLVWGPFSGMPLPPDQIAKSLYSGFTSSIGGSSMPAATVALVACSTRMNEPVSRFVA